MYSVEVKNSCSCAIKRAIAESQSFDSKEEAEEEADHQESQDAPGAHPLRQGKEVAGLRDCDHEHDPTRH